MSEGQLWDTRTGGAGARLFFGTSVGIVEEMIGDKLVLGKAMLRGRGLLTSTGEAGALAVVPFKVQTSNHNTIRGLFPNNPVRVNQWQTKVNKPPSEHLKLPSDTAVEQYMKTLHYLVRSFLAFSKLAEEAFVFFFFLIFIFARRDCCWQKYKHTVTLVKNMTAQYCSVQFTNWNTCMRWRGWTHRRSRLSCRANKHTI